MRDAEVLELGATQHRALVTYNTVDFEALAGQWFAPGQRHSGIVLVSERTISQRAVGGLVRGLPRLAGQYPGVRPFDDQAIYLTRER